MILRVDADSGNQGRNGPGYEQATWRLLVTGFQDGATNMATDEAILEAVAAGKARPTLRLYGWVPACLSLGYGQSWDDAYLTRCRSRGWGIVRRPTGGRAILHLEELTYSVSVPIDEPRVAGGIVESYHRLSRALIESLHSMGLAPVDARPEYADSDVSGLACFDGPGKYEISLDGRKLIGSAQVRRKGVVLQHGAIPLQGDIARAALALADDGSQEQDEIREGLRARATTLEAALGRAIGFAEVADHIESGFSQALNLNLSADTLSGQEKARVAELVAEKYGNLDWLSRH